MSDANEWEECTKCGGVVCRPSCESQQNPPTMTYLWNLIASLEGVIELQQAAAKATSKDPGLVKRMTREELSKAAQGIPSRIACRHRGRVEIASEIIENMRRNIGEYMPLELRRRILRGVEALRDFDVVMDIAASKSDIVASE